MWLESLQNEPIMGKKQAGEARRGLTASSNTNADWPVRGGNVLTVGAKELGGQHGLIVWVDNLLIWIHED